MFQELILVGNLGDEPQMRYTPAGIAVANFSLAVNKVWSDANGQRQEKTTWFRVSAWRKQAELVSQYLHKGSRVLVRGEVECRAYADKQGQPAASMEVTADMIRFLTPKGEIEATQSAAASVADLVPDNKADIPF